VKILVIGGTADGRKLATALFELGFDITYSIAGDFERKVGMQGNSNSKTELIISGNNK